MIILTATDAGRYVRLFPDVKFNPPGGFQWLRNSITGYRMLLNDAATYNDEVQYGGCHEWEKFSENRPLSPGGWYLTLAEIANGHLIVSQETP